MFRRTTTLVLVLSIVPVMVFAAPKITAITMNPTTAPAGTRVTIAVTFQNESATLPYRCTLGDPWDKAKVFVTNNAAGSAPYPFDVNVPLPYLGPGESRTVTVPTQWTIPADENAQYWINVWPPLCGEEAPPGATVKLMKTCAYTAPVRLVPTNPAIKLPPRRPAH